MSCDHQKEGFKICSSTPKWENNQANRREYMFNEQVGISLDKQQINLWPLCDISLRPTGPLPVGRAQLSFSKYWCGFIIVRMTDPRISGWIWYQAEKKISMFEYHWSKKSGSQNGWPQSAMSPCAIESRCHNADPMEVFECQQQTFTRQVRVDMQILSTATVMATYQL